MRMSEGVEWAIHCCITLAWLDEGEPVSTARFAAEFGIAPSYLNKFLQALVRAEILKSTAGARGGFVLARRPEKVSLFDIVVAIEGDEEAFRCTEIRKKGAGACAAANAFKRPCAIAAAMRKAEQAWRRELKGQTLADVMAAAPIAAMQRTRDWHRKSAN